MDQRIQIGNDNPDISAQQGELPKPVQQQKSMKQILGLENAAHPEICFASVIFKVVAVLCYIIFNHGPVSNFVNAFITTTIMLAVDFWIIKNVSGRCLVGLRWWNKINDDGTDEWIYESKETEAQANRVDYVCFWYPQVIITLTFAIFAVINFLALDWGIGSLDVVCLALVGVNFMQFYKCSKHHQDKLKALRGQIVQQVAQKAVDTAIHNPAMMQNAAKNMMA